MPLTIDSENNDARGHLLNLCTTLTELFDIMAATLAYLRNDHPRPKEMCDANHRACKKILPKLAAFWPNFIRAYTKARINQAQKTARNNTTDVPKKYLHKLEVASFLTVTGILIDYMQHPDPMVRSAGESVILEHLDWFKEYGSILNESLLNSFLKNPVLLKELIPIIVDNIRSAELNYDLLAMGLRAHHYGYRESTAIAEAAYGRLQELLAPYQITNAKQFLDAWLHSHEDKSFILAKVIRNNLETMRDLEALRPGICRALNEEFGIFCFARYPTALLIEQYARRDDDQLPYGTVFYPKNDHNGAFYYSNQLLSSLFQRLDGKYYLRVFEGGDKVSLAQAFHQLKNRYSTHLISFALLGGHGTPQSINLGHPPSSYKTNAKDIITTDDLLDPKNIRRHPVGKWSKYFAKGATIILESCSTGMQSGIGQILSQLLGLRVIGPDKDSALNSIDVDFKDQQIEFQAQYHDAATKAYASGQPGQP